MTFFLSATPPEGVLEAWYSERFDFPLSGLKTSARPGPPFGFSAEIDDDWGRADVRVDHLAELTARVGCEAVTSYGYGYTHVLVDAAGSAWDVAFDEDTRTVTGRRPFAGEFSAVEPLPREAAGTLAGLLGVAPEQLQLSVREVRDTSRAFDGVFPEVTPVVSDESYPYHFTVAIDRDREPWLPESQSALQWVAVVSGLATRLKTVLLVHHRAFSVVRNIPGGSDSQVHAVRVGARGCAIAPLKRARARWK